MRAALGHRPPDPPPAGARPLGDRLRGPDAARPGARVRRDHPGLQRRPSTRRSVVVDLTAAGSPTCCATTSSAELTATGIADIVTVADEAAATAEVDAGRARRAIVIPAGFSDAVTSRPAGRAADHRRQRRDRPRGGARRRSSRFAADVGAVQLAVAHDRGGRRRGRTRRPSRPPRPAIARREPDPVGRRAADEAPGVDGHLLRRGDGDPVRLLRGPVRRAGAARRASRRDAQPAARGPDPARGHRARQGPRQHGPRDRLDDDHRRRDHPALVHAAGVHRAASPILILATVLAATGIATLVVDAREDGRPGRRSRRDRGASAWRSSAASFIPLSQAPEGLGDR